MSSSLKGNALSALLLFPQVI